MKGPDVAGSAVSAGRKKRGVVRSKRLIAERTDIRELERRRILLAGSGVDDRARLGLHGTVAAIKFDDDVVILKVIRGPSAVCFGVSQSRLISDRASAVSKTPRSMW
jgi:hypothetical protein